jgi:dihydroorotase
MREFVLAGGRVIDPSNGRDLVADVLVADGVVAAVSSDLQTEVPRIDVSGCVVLPGFVDLHTHLREPGREDAETVLTGSRAAALGGYTAISPMANTDPVADSAAVVELVAKLGEQAGYVDVFPVGALTVGLAGERLAEIGEMFDSAARVNFFSDDGKCVQDAGLMLRAMEYAATFGAVVANHAEDRYLHAGGHMHEGPVSARLGVRGIPPEAEEIIVARDLMLSRRTRCRLHVPHVSTARSLSFIAAAKENGVPVTAEVCPHHLVLTDEAVCNDYDPVYKVAPPLRPRADVEALRQGLIDGVIDIVATDHAPHPQADKEHEFDRAPCGMLNLETAAALVHSELVANGSMSWLRFAEVMSSKPAAIRGFADHGSLGEDAPANICVFDPTTTWTVDRDAVASKSKNTPFHGWTLQGRVRHTIFNGRFTVKDGVIN